jgi:hypothetical protein
MLINRNPRDPMTSSHINNLARYARPAVVGAAGIALSVVVVACGGSNRSSTQTSGSPGPAAHAATVPAKASTQIPAQKTATHTSPHRTPARAPVPAAANRAPEHAPSTPAPQVAAAAPERAAPERKAPAPERKAPAPERKAPAPEPKQSTQSSETAGIPQNNGGDMDADNNGGPSDGDGNV